MKLLVIAGTKDARELIGYLIQRGYFVSASVASELGEQYLKEYESITIYKGRLLEKDMEELLQKEQFFAVVDASHPYAQNISVCAMACCRRLSVLYIRLERPQSVLYGENVVFVNDYDEMVLALNKICGNILMTTGTNHLAQYQKVTNWKERVFIRVLPTKESYEKSMQSGFLEKNIIAQKGPFSVEDNLRHIKTYQINALVTKESGNAGGLKEKFLAAKEAGIIFVVLKRPNIAYYNLCHLFEEVVCFLEENK